MPINYKKYPPNWKTDIVPAIIIRSCNCCENCGVHNGVSVWSYKDGGKTRWSPSGRSRLNHPKGKTVKVVLTTAHLDHDEHNHEVKLDRLKALCQLCHLRYDAQEKKKRRLNKQQ